MTVDWIVAEAKSRIERLAVVDVFLLRQGQGESAQNQDIVPSRHDAQENRKEVLVDWESPPRYVEIVQSTDLPISMNKEI